MKNIYCFIVIGIMLSFNIILFVKFYRQPQGKDDSGKLQSLESVYEVLHGNVFLQYESENSKMNNIIGEVNRNETVDFKSLLSDGAKLVFRYTEDNCDICVNEALKSLMKFSSAFGNEDIIILTSYQNVRVMQIFTSKYAPGIMIFNTQKELNIPLEEWNVPYFFVIEKSFDIHSVFIPIKEIPEYTDKYLNIIFERLFTN